jgi:hypothetical protein
MFIAVRRLIASFAVIALLVSCGGGTSQIQAFAPTRVIAFGDEASVLTLEGRNYAINGVAADGVSTDCNALLNWVQILAFAYRMGFAECPLAGVNEPRAFIRARPGAKADDLRRQVDAQEAAGGFTGTDLVTVLAGANDVMELYQQYPGKSDVELIAQARQRGELIAGQVNRLVSLGAKVIVSTVPDLGLSPFARTQSAAGATLLANLTAALNGRIRVNILNDGRYIGLLLADEFVQTASRAPGLYGMTDSTSAACVVALPDCTTQTLISSNGPETWLWADGSRLATGGHKQLGALALTRAQRNPF